MANYGTYASLAEFKTDLGITDTTDDTRFRRALERASRWINNRCGRHFSVRSETRYFTPSRVDRLLIDDLLSVTTLKTDEDNDYDYDYTWDGTVTTGDYLLEPFNAYPKTLVRVHPNGDYNFYPSQSRSVEIAGLWGYGDGESATPYDDSGADTSEALDASETAIDISDQSLLSVGQTILIGSEQMYVTALSDGTPDVATVVRGVNGTTAATHETAQSIYIYRYPEDIVAATILRAAQLHYGINAPVNIMGSINEQAAFQPVQLYARILDLIGPYRRDVV